MEKDINFINIVRRLLGNEMYEKFLTQVTRENNKTEIPLGSFCEEVFVKYCFVSLIMGIPSEIELDSIKVSLKKTIIDGSLKDFAIKYEEYIRVIEKNIIAAIKTVK